MKRIPIAVQLFSVRDELKKDMPGTLQKMAEIGYQGVEFFGKFSWPAEQVKAALDAAGLTCVGWHIGYDAIAPASIYATIAYCKAIGAKTLAVPGLPSAMTESAAAWRETAKKFSEVAEILSANGIRLGYHNHDAEFKPLETGECAWDIFMSSTTDAVFGQLDNGNAMSGGADALALLKKYPGRAYTCHLKPYSKENGFATMIGEDDVPWGAWFEEIDRQGTTAWYIVEYECEKMYSQVEGVRRCLRAVEKYLG